MAHTVKDNNRRNITLTTSKVGEVVPEYFGEENAKLISFLEKYLDHLDSDQAGGFGYKIKQLIYARDADQTNVEELDKLIEEIGNGLKSSSFFQKPRLMAKLLADFYRAKGSLNSAEGFFRGFFGLEPEIHYPKRDLFIVGESSIGFEDQKFLVNAGIYQVFSILIKCGISTVDYETLYKRFVHPAGFHFAGEVIAIDQAKTQIEEPVLGGLFVGPTAIGLDPLEVDSDPVLVTQAFVSDFTGVRTDGSTEQDVSPLAPFYQITTLLDSGGRSLYSPGDAFRVNPLGNKISQIQNLTVNQFLFLYDNIAQVLHPNSFTFDDSANSQRPDFSVDLETMDNEIFTTYLSDSAY